MPDIFMVKFFYKIRKRGLSMLKKLTALALALITAFSVSGVSASADNGEKEKNFIIDQIK